MNRAARTGCNRTRWIGGIALLALATGCAVVPEPPREPAPVARPAPPPLPVHTTPARDWALAAATQQGTILRGIAPATTVALRLDGMTVPVADDGAFLIGFDRDAAPRATLAATLADGRVTTRTIAVAMGKWDIQNVDASPTGGVSSAEFLRRREPELARIVAARAQDSDSDGWRQDFAWPLDGPITGVFGSQRVYRGTPGSYHGGVDIARPTGTPFRAPADGVVVLAAETPFTLEGRLLMIDHGNGLNSAFLHCSALYVRAGDRVRQGQPLGEVGATGRATGPHLHWAMKWRAARIDPRSLARPAR